MDTVLAYTCFAYPPEEINMYIPYTFGQDKKGCYIQNGENKQYFDLEFIKMLFTPKDKTWEEVIQ